jgi:hypothetical protein
LFKSLLVVVHTPAGGATAITTTLTRSYSAEGLLSFLVQLLEDKANNNRAGPTRSELAVQWEKPAGLSRTGEAHKHGRFAAYLLNQGQGAAASWSIKNSKTRLDQDLIQIFIYQIKISKS